MNVKRQLFLSNIGMLILPFLITGIFFCLFISIAPRITRANLSYTGISNSIKSKVRISSYYDKLFEDSQDKLLDKEYQQNILNVIINDELDLVVTKNNEIIFYSKPISNIEIEKFIRQSSDRKLFNSVNVNGESYNIKKIPLSFPDGKQGVVIIYKLIPNEEKFVETFLIIILSVFIISFLSTNMLLVWIFSKNILLPLNDLKKAAIIVSEGNLDYGVVERGSGEIRELSRIFEEMRIKFKELLAIQKRYDQNRKMIISSISHDIKTPITSIKGYIEGIFDGVANNPEKIEKYLSVIKSKSIQVDTMINDLMLYSRLDLNQEKFNFEITDIQKYIEDCVAESKFELSRYGIEFDFQNGIQEKTDVYIDRLKLQRVISNIIDNSKKYMDKEKKQINLILRENNSEVIIEITDNGSGISRENLNYIFDRFYREDLARTRASGSGIGLAISKQIIEEHDGKIWAISEKSYGTSILIALKKHK